jgi:hypothetical protein
MFLYKPPNLGESSMSVTVAPIQPAIGVEITGMSASQLVIREAAHECQRLLDVHGSSCTAG